MLQSIAPHEIPQVAALLVRAFRDNPAMVGVLKGDSAETRGRVLGRCMVGFVRTAHLYGTIEVIRDGEAIVATAMYFAPATYPPPLRGQLITALAVLRAGLRRALRFAHLDREMQTRHLHEPHWYLWFLGVEPTHQGKGLGSRLLRSLNERANASGAPCYLETDKQTSVHLYQRHRYEVTSTAQVSAVDTQMWFMRRA